MNKKKIALSLAVSMLLSSPLYGCNTKNDVTDKDKKEAQQQQSVYVNPFMYYPNSFFQGYYMNNGVRTNTDYYGWHSWTAPTSGVKSPYTSSSSNVKSSSGGIKPTSGHITSKSGYSGVHAGSVSG